ncbi:type I pullulanase [Polaribacter sp. Q13]|uniref:type I pullulanase n=1 Tax=Polaribacter sp. Q13 TaxID=2806551 RepID=UPI00193B25A0|nr:type I pullulanase [Polaribacter sp. Q13]QVY65272.1 type I pullulanase [Polaribacter sp. Q13]
MEQNPHTFSSFEEYPTTDKSLWLDYSKEQTTFKIWSPRATAVKLNLYKTGNDSEVFETLDLSPEENGVWFKTIEKDLDGIYYTYQTYIDDNWLTETPGIYAKAVGVNGNRAMVFNAENTNPKNWEQDTYVQLDVANNAIIYELHIRNITIQKEANSSYPGKYLGLIEKGVKSTQNVPTAIDHIIRLGITHVHLLPTFDQYSIDETDLGTPQFNWGYDPQNYNVPEGSFSTNPFKAEVRIKEFKTMVQAFHDAGIGVVLDVVYNHTGVKETSNFNLENPGYYYRFNEDGSYSNASGCGNETASERKMTQKFMIESVKYWTEEYHLDGFRFDLMAIHDIETMNLIADEVNKINPNAIIYGEGWVGGDSPLPEEKRALKKHIPQMPKIAAFSDNIRDAIKGAVFHDTSTGFVSGAKFTEESIKCGIVGAIQHPQVNYQYVNYSNDAWAKEPWQAINYVSCHDNFTLYDKLKISRPDASSYEIKAMHKLSTAIVLTSQGTPFLHEGSEMMSTKKGDHNSYKSPDSINEIDWNLKVKNSDVLDYYKNLIKLRKEHPAFRMPTAKEVQDNLRFKKIDDGLVSYQLRNNANFDSWSKILVIFNAQTHEINYELDQTWKIAVLKDSFDLEGKESVTDNVIVPPISMMVLFQKKMNANVKYYKEQLLGLIEKLFIETGDARSRFLNCEEKLKAAYLASKTAYNPKEVIDTWDALWHELNVKEALTNKSIELKSSYFLTVKTKRNASLEKFLLFFLKEMSRLN